MKVEILNSKVKLKDWIWTKAIARRVDPVFQSVVNEWAASFRGERLTVLEVPMDVIVKLHRDGLPDSYFLLDGRELTGVSSGPPDPNNVEYFVGFQEETLQFDAFKMKWDPHGRRWCISMTSRDRSPGVDIALRPE